MHAYDDVVYSTIVPSGGWLLQYISDFEKDNDIHGLLFNSNICHIVIMLLSKKIK